MSSKIDRKHRLGKGMESLLGGHVDNVDISQMLSELEKKSSTPVEMLSTDKIVMKAPQDYSPEDTVSGLNKSRHDAQDETKDKVLSVAIDAVIPNPDQPRKSFDEEGLKDLSESIRRQGILQPLLVEEVSPGRYSIIAGERRYRAARMAGLKSVPVLVRRLTEIHRLEVALIENIQREDLNPIDEAYAYQFLIQRSGFTQEELAGRVGRSRSAITNSLRLLQLPDGMKDDLVSGVITPGHARAILSCTNPSDRIVLRNRIVEKDLSVRAAEAEAEALNQGKKLILRKKSGQKDRDPDLQDVEDRFLDAFGTRVELKGSLKKGRLVIPFRTTRELERIYSLLRDEPLFSEE